MTKKKENRSFIWFLFFLYLLFVVKVIIFKYPYEQLLRIAESWRKEVILEGLDTANFTPLRPYGCM